MGARGRTSGAELATKTDLAKALEKTDRPNPLPELTTEQGDIWIDIVGRLPADWFPRETHELLAQYCRHCVSANKIAQLITRAEHDQDFEIDDYDKLLKMQEREGRAISSLATRMRITQQATYDPKKKKPKSSSKLWD